jgi:ubiquinone biosynthesis protein
MVFEDGFFHADPHPGNFFVEPDGRLGLIDFGMVGTVDQRTRDQLVGVVFAITSQDTDQLVDVFLELGLARGPIKRDLLRRDLEHLVARYWGRALGEIAIGPLLQEVLAIIRRHHLQLPANLALLIKTVVMEEGLGQRLDPDFQLPAVLEPYARQLLMRQFSPARWARRLGRSSLDAAQLGVELPRHLRRLLGGLERGNLEVSVRPTGLEPLLERAERLANRIVLGVIVAAFINGLAILLSVYRPLGWGGWVGGFFAIGFLVAVVVGAYLAWSILRSGRR